MLTKPVARQQLLAVQCWNETKGQALAVQEAVSPMLDLTTNEAAEQWAEEATLEMVEGEVSSLVP